MSGTPNLAELIGGRSAEIDGLSGQPTAATLIYRIIRPFAAIEFDLDEVTGLPEPFSAHPKYTGLRVAKYSLSEPTARTWNVTVEYAIPEGPGAEEGEDPIFVKRFRWQDAEYTRDLAFDADSGDIVCNSAGDPFDSVPQVGTVAHQVEVVILSNDEPSSLAEYQGTVNAAEYTIGGITFAAKACRLRITSTETGGTVYAYEHTLTFTGRVNIALVAGVATDIGWQEAIIDRGFRSWRVGGGGPGDPAYPLEYATIKTDAGEIVPATEPILLDGSGSALVLTGSPPPSPVALIFNAHKSKDWSALPI